MAEECNVTMVPSGQGKSTNPNAIWTTVTKLRRGASKWKSWQRSNIRNANGVEGKSPSENATNFSDFYLKLFANGGEKEQATEWYSKMPRTPQDRDWLQPQMWEMEAAIQELKNTAPGLSGLPSTVWKTLVRNQEMKNAMLVVLTKCWEEETIPQSWVDFYMTVLPKKGDLSLPANWRGISIQETFAKVYTTILKRRLNELYETLAKEYSNGFRKGRGRSDCIYALLETLRRRKQWGLDSWVIFFDCVKMFDRIPRSHIWSSMRVLGISEKMIRIIKSTLQGAKGVLHVDQETRSVPMPDGSGQGTILGPLLCNLFLLPLICMWIEKWRHHSTVFDNTESFSHIFADDTCIIAHDKQAAATLGADFADFLLDFGIEVHIGSDNNSKPKTVVLFIPSITPAPHAPATTWPVDPTAILQLHPAPRDPNKLPRFIPSMASALYLGHRIANDLSSQTHMTERMSKATQLFGALRKNFLGSKDVWAKVKSRVFQSMILPTLLDGVECCMLTRAIMDELTTTYHRMVRSALRITPMLQRQNRITSETMLLRLGLQPLHYYVDLKTLGFAGHIERMNSTRLPKLLRDSALPGPKKRGGQHKTHLNFIQQSLRRKGIPCATWKELAQDRTAWAKAVRSASTIGARITANCRRKLKDAWAYVPRSLIGKHVEKRFGGKHYVGTITNIDTDEDTNENLWHVQYDDSDSEDYTEDELAKILCDDYAEFEALL